MIRYGSDGSERDELIYGGSNECVKQLHGTRYNPPVISAAWSNRCGTFWLADNLRYDDYSMMAGEPSGWLLSASNGILSIEGNGLAVLAPTNDRLAFVAGYSSRGDSAVQIETNAAGQERLWFGSYRCVRMEDIPSLTNLAVVELSLSMHTNAMFTYGDSAAGQTAALVLGSNAQDVVISVFSLDTLSVIASGTGSVEWVCETEPCIISIRSPEAKDMRGRLVPTQELREAMRTTLALYPRVPGFMTAIQEPGMLPLVVAEGYARIDPPSTNGSAALVGNEHFRIASISKFYTATAIMLLRDRGLLHLTNTVAELAPELKAPRGGEITVELLLAHRSGLPDANNTPWIDDKLNANRFQEFTVEEIVAVASNMYPNLMFEPGTDYHYTDTGYNILARIIENVSGTNYQAFMRSDVLTPLGLTNTFVPDNDDYDVPAPVMHAYATVDGVYDDWTRYSLSAELGCGSVITDVAELMRFASLALHSTNLLSAESRTLMMTPLSQTGSDTWYGRGAQWKDGFGWGHGGDMWGMNSYVAVDTNNGVCVAAVNNGMEYDDVQKLFNAIFALYSAMGVAKDMLGYEAGDYYGSKPPVIINTQPSGRAGAAQAFTILNGNFVTNWTASNLPPGMMIEAASGVITGTPSVTGLYEVVLVAENSRGFATNTLTYTVAPGYTNTIAQMTDFLNGAQVSNEFVGMSVVLVDEDGIVWSEGFGWADHAGSVAASADTVYRIGSVSKLFSTVSALRECDRGRLALDAAITNYVPDFMPEPRLDTNLPPIDYEANPITVRSLLNHLSGIPSTYMRHAMTTRSTWIGVYPDYLSEMMVGILNDYSGMPVDFYASYNNNGFQVAEYLIQQTADASYANYAHSNLFLALGMSRSGMDMDAQALSNTLAESFFDDLSAASKEYVNCLGSGGALSTANDMGAFLGMLLNAGEGPYAPVLQPGTVTEMMSPQTEHATLNPGTKFFAPGLGWDTIVLPEFGYAGGGCSKNGETTTFAAYAAIATNQQLAVFAAKNSPNAGGPTEAAQRLLRLAIEEKTGLTPTNSAVLPESPFVLAAQTNVDALAGYYVNDSGYAKLRAGTNCLLYGGSALYLREDGWWSETNEPPFLMGFTNFAARRFVRLRMVYNGYLETMLVGQQYEPPALPDVWSNRVDTTWLVASLPDVSYMRAHPGTLSVRLWQTNGLLMLSVPSIYLDNYSRGYFSHTDMVIEPYDDGMAFVQGAGGKMPCSVRCDDSSIFVNSYFWMNTEEIPHLASGATTNFAPYPLMTDWFAFNAQAGVEYFLNLGGAVTGIVMLADANGDYLGDGSQGAMLRWTCPSSGVYYAGINFPMDAPDEVEVSVYNYSNTIAHMQSWFQTQIDQTNAVGISVALVDDQEVVWAEGFGYANLAEGKPVTTNTVFHIGSVSKTFTSATALQYLDKGTLDLDTAFTNYIPEVSWKARYPSADDITVRDLLAMYSGLPGDLIRGGFLTVPQDVGYQNVTNDLAADYPIYPPQFTWSYCNTAFILMQGIIENLANTGTTVRPFTQIADDSLFTPLDMEGTSYIKDKPVISNELAVAYRGTEAMPEEYISLYGTGSMYSRPIDLCRFMAMINRAGGGYLSSNTLEVMTTAQGTNTPFAHLYFFDTGLGWDMVRHPALNYAGRMCNKNGGTITFSAMMEMLLDHKLGVAVSVSSRSTIPDVSAIETLRYALYDKTGIHWPTNEVSLLAPTQTVSAASLEALEGYYANAGGLDHVVADTNALTLTYIGNLELGGSPVSNLVLRTNGVFVSDDVPVMGYIFTNVAGYDVVQNRIKLDDTTLINVMHAVRLTNMPVISAAWLARTGQTWFAQNINPYSYLPLENTTPELKLQVVEGILCAVSGGLVADAVLRPHNDTLAFVEGLTIRGDSSVKVIESGSEEYLLIGGYMFGPQPMDATFDTNVTGSIANAGFAHWYRVETAVPDAVNGVSNLYYEITGSRMPDNFLIRLYEDYGTTLVDQQTGSGTLGFNADTMPLYLSVQPDITGTQTGDYQLAFSYPLLLRQIQTVSNRLVVTWQGKSNTVATLETAADLAATNAFVPAITNLTAPGMLNAVTNDVGPDPYRFYRIMEGAAAYSNRYGRVVFISDQHMSPFASSFIVGQLLASDVSVWDTILQSATNGYYTRDATGYHVTTPMMYNSALVNAAAACPQPDAVIMPGDLATYSFRSNYQKVTGDYEEENWKRLLTKMIEYTLYRANETFPGVPIYCALGNGDSFAGDYDIDVGGAFLMTSAPVFFNYGLSNVTDYMSFCATYTNEGNYCAPFAAGEMITLETTFMSKNYPGSLEYGSNQLAYLEARLQACRDAGKPAWVLQHIPPGVSAYGTWSHWKTGDTTHVSCDLHEAFIESYNQIIADYRDTVKTIICGHYHERGWQIANDPATSNATVGIQVMNGLLFNHGNNSGFTVMTYDRETLEPVREYSYNLPQSYAGKTGAASWNLRFSENQGFGIDDLSAASLLTAWSNMTDVGSAGYNYFNRQYSGGRQPYLMSSNSWPVYHGVIRWIERDQFLNNVHK
jgi:CubicO group peptidase (beta-lactamase class C family)